LNPRNDNPEILIGYVFHGALCHNRCYRPRSRLTPCRLATEASAKTRAPAELPRLRLELPACVSFFDGGVMRSLPVRFFGILLLA
jgi:hypothetical protein